MKINKNLICIEDFLFQYLKQHLFTSKQYCNDFKRRHFWKLHRIISSIWPDIWLFSVSAIHRKSGKSNPASQIRYVKSVSGRIQDIKKAGLSGRPYIRCIPTKNIVEKYLSFPATFSLPVPKTFQLTRYR
jgi:hypothetical protein